MSDYKLVSFEPTPEMVEAAEDAYMPFGDMDLAIRMAILAAPAVQGEPVATVTEEVFGSDGTSDFISARLPVGTNLYTAPQPAEHQPAPDVAGLVEALESAKNLIANHSGEVLPDEYAGDQIEQIDAALAELEKRNG